jgi:hypothetical protein
MNAIHADLEDVKAQVIALSDMLSVMEGNRFSKRTPPGPFIICLAYLPGHRPDTAGNRGVKPVTRPPEFPGILPS